MNHEQNVYEVGVQKAVKQTSEETAGTKTTEEVACIVESQEEQLTHVAPPEVQANTWQQTNPF